MQKNNDLPSFPVLMYVTAFLPPSVNLNCVAPSGTVPTIVVLVCSTDSKEATINRGTHQRLDGK